MKTPMTFFEVITAAVNDFVQHGYDSSERLEFWMQRIAEAARRDMVSRGFLEETLRKHLHTLYQKYVDRGGLLKNNPGVSRFTLEMVKPQLRAELDRRIYASAQLIQLNREASIQQTLQRFSGWATSIPAGGSDVVERVETKRAIRKSLTSLPFEERRVIIDQGHKFAAALSETVALAGGALAAIWHSHWRQQNYNYREDHKERDMKVYAVRDNWALQKGLMKAGSAGYTDEVTSPGEEVFCFPGSTELTFADGVEKLYRRFYSGELAVLTMGDGKTLRATLNHPVLTVDGWVAIGLLKEGDYVVKVSNETLDIPEGYKHNAITSFSECFESARESGTFEVRAGASEQFHGDGTENDVDIILPASHLTFGSMPSGDQSALKFALSEPNNSSTRFGPFNDGFIAGGFSPESGVSGSDKEFSAFNSFSAHPDKISGASISNFNTTAFQSFIQKCSGGIEFSGQGEDAIPLGIRLEKIIHVERRNWAGHVFNLQTEEGWYIADGVVSHNCRCFHQWIYSLESLPPDMLTAKGEAELKRVREIIRARG